MEVALEVVDKGDGAIGNAFGVLQARLEDVLLELDYLHQGIISRVYVAHQRDLEAARDVEDPFEMSDEEYLAYLRQTLAELAEDLRLMAMSDEA